MFYIIFPNIYLSAYTHFPAITKYHIDYFLLFLFLLKCAKVETPPSVCEPETSKDEKPSESVVVI